jgi:ATP phosphoribosyltransferase
MLNNTDSSISPDQYTQPKLGPARLRIAIQKKGRLSEDSQALLKRSGLRFKIHSGRLVVPVENHPVDLLLVRDDDIPQLVMEGLADLGIVGENILEEVALERQSQQDLAQYQRLRSLDFGYCRLAIAVDKDKDIHALAELANQRIATSYPRLLKRYFNEHGIPYTLCPLTGSVEVAPRAGLADAICDLVSTGATLEANGLKEIFTIFESNAMLIQRQGPMSSQSQQWIEGFLVRVNSIIQARESKYIMLHAPKSQLEAIKDLLPGAEEPSILPLNNSLDRVAVHLVSGETLFWETMEALKALGASSILVLPIEKMMG